MKGMLLFCVYYCYMIWFIVDDTFDVCYVVLWWYHCCCYSLLLLLLMKWYVHCWYLPLLMLILMMLLYVGDAMPFICWWWLLLCWWCWYCYESYCIDVVSCCCWTLYCYCEVIIIVLFCGNCWWYIQKRTLLAMILIINYVHYTMYCYCVVDDTILGIVVVVLVVWYRCLWCWWLLWWWYLLLLWSWCVDVIWYSDEGNWWRWPDDDHWLLMENVIVDVPLFIYHCLLLLICLFCYYSVYWLLLFWYCWMIRCYDVIILVWLMMTEYIRDDILLILLCNYVLCIVIECILIHWLHCWMHCVILLKKWLTAIVGHCWWRIEKLTVSCWPVVIDVLMQLMCVIVMILMLLMPVVDDDMMCYDIVVTVVICWWWKQYDTVEMRDGGDDIGIDIVVVAFVVIVVPLPLWYCILVAGCDDCYFGGILMLLFWLFYCCCIVVHTEKWSCAREFLVWYCSSICLTFHCCSLLLTLCIAIENLENAVGSCYSICYFVILLLIALFKQFLCSFSMIMIFVYIMPLIRFDHCSWWAVLITTCYCCSMFWCVCKCVVIVMLSY